MSLHILSKQYVRDHVVIYFSWCRFDFHETLHCRFDFRDKFVTAEKIYIVLISNRFLPRLIFTAVLISGNIFVAVSISGKIFVAVGVFWGVQFMVYGVGYGHAHQV